MQKQLNHTKEKVYRPVVKFRNIDPKILKQVQDEEKMDSEVSESDSESDSESESNDRDNDNFDDGGLTAAESAYTGPPGNSLIKIEVDVDVDITSPSLRDLLSDKPVVAERSEQSAVAPKPPQSASVEEDIDWEAI